MKRDGGQVEPHATSTIHSSLHHMEDKFIRKLNKNYWKVSVFSRLCFCRDFFSPYTIFLVKSKIMHQRHNFFISNELS
jgi:hypothetical protein